MAIISERLLQECVLLDPQEQDKEHIYRRMVDLLAEAHHIADPDQLFADIMKREALSSTCLGVGCAVPHAHSRAVSSTVLAAARLNPPLDFNAPDDEPISLVFLMAGPDANAGIHIKILSKLARLLHNPSFREELKLAETQESFLRIIEERER